MDKVDEINKSIRKCSIDREYKKGDIIRAVKELEATCKKIYGKRSPAGATIYFHTILDHAFSRIGNIFGVRFKIETLIDIATKLDSLGVGLSESSRIELHNAVVSCEKYFNLVVLSIAGGSVQVEPDYVSLGSFSFSQKRFFFDRITAFCTVEEAMEIVGLSDHEVSLILEDMLDKVEFKPLSKKTENELFNNLQRGIKIHHREAARASLAKRYFPHTNYLPVNIWDDYNDGDDTFLYVECSDTSEDLRRVVCGEIAWLLKRERVICKVKDIGNPKVILKKLKHDQIPRIRKILQGQKIMIFELIVYSES